MLQLVIPTHDWQLAEQRLADDDSVSAVPARLPRDDLADPGASHCDGSTCPRPQQECQVMLELLELADARLDLRSTALDQLANVSARRCPAIANPDHLADFRDGQADGLGRANERQPRQQIRLVRATPRSSDEHMSHIELGARAAIALTAQTDAVAIHVSPATSIISFANSGRLVRNLQPDKLRDVPSWLER